MRDEQTRVKLLREQMAKWGQTATPLRLAAAQLFNELTLDEKLEFLMWSHLWLNDSIKSLCKEVLQLRGELESAQRTAKEKTTHATEARQKPEDDLEQHQDGNARGPAAKAGRRDRDAQGRHAQTESKKGEVIDSAGVGSS
jgi:hypothetical protein